MKRIYLVFIGLVIGCLATKAQEKQVLFEQITNESGRSLGFITGIVQDQTGFMWFGTRKGLYRYNGYSYKLFKHNNNDSTSLPYNDIAWLYYDKNQNLWLRHYDELGVFYQEKTIDKFKKITNNHYDMEVKVIFDKKGNYWIGPTGKGLLRYQPETDSLTLYSNPPRSYGDDTWKMIDSLISKQIAISEVNNPHNNMDTTITSNITEAGDYLVIASGESDARGVYDFGYIKRNNENIWQLSHEKSMWSGGAEKNRFEAKIITLDKGLYQVGYISDGSHCCGDWQGEAPDKTKFCGIKLVAIDKKTAILLNQLINKPAQPKTFICSNQIKSLLTDNDGNTWVLTDKGIEKFDYKRNVFDHFDIPFEELLGVPVTREYLLLYQDKQGIFWIGSQYGLIRYDNLWGKFTVFQNTEKTEILTSNSIFSIFEDHTGLLWIGTDKGINLYDRNRNIISNITADNKNRLYDNRIIQIFEDRSNNIWVATFEGLNRLIKSSFTYTNLGIEASSEYPVTYDNGANIWFAFGNKITKYSRNLTTKQVFTLPDKIFNKDEFTGERDYVIDDMVITEDNNIWVATDNKVSRYNILDQEIDFSYTAHGIVVGKDSLKSRVKRLIAGNGNELYALCPNGIIALNSFYAKRTGTYYFPLQYDFIEDVDQNYFKTAIKDKNGNIWIRTAEGIYQFNPRLLQLQIVSKFEAAIKTGPGSAGQIDEDENGNIWFAALPELHCINSATFADSIWKAPFEHDWGTAHVKVGKNLIFIYGANGLYTFDPQLKNFNYYSVEDGFIDNSINGIEEDKLGYLWITSLKGLTKLDLNETTCLNYFTSSDLTVHQFLGNPPDFKVPSGELILFTTDGFVAFHPDSINRQIPKVVVDKFTIRGKEFPLDSVLMNKSQITLNYKQNFVNFEFAVLDYTVPQLNKYKYKLEGVDEDWITTDADNRKAQYQALAPGKYKFRVIGSNNDKIWNEEGVSIEFIITPPWYKTIVAYIAYILITITVVWSYIKWREKKLKEEKHILEQKVKERTAEIMAQKEELAAQNEKIAQQHKDITDSIHYAQRIQRAILPKAEPLKEVVEDYFILYRPRDIVSGDYYWTTRHENYTVIVAADCTGHGVPGAFMSMLGVAFLNEIINKERILMPNHILDRLRDNIMKSLHQTGADGESKDGMDISLYVIDHSANILRFSGAYNPLYVIRDGEEAITLKADRMPIGYHIKKDTPFTMEEFQLKKGDCLYNSSDGYPDQFGGEDGRKFMSKNFRELLQEIHQLPMCEQKEILNTRFDAWRGTIEQIDDVIVFGVRI